MVIISEVASPNFFCSALELDRAINMSAPDKLSLRPASQFQP